MKVFESYLTRQKTLPPADARALLKIAQEVRIEKGERVVGRNEEHTGVIFVERGCLHSFLHERKSRRYSLHFALEQEWVMDPYSLIHPSTSAPEIEALERTVAVQLPGAELEKLAHAHAGVELFMRQLLHEQLLQAEQRIRELLTKTAKVRYQEFAHAHPDWAGRIPLQYIASYLGICSPSLSRIRKPV